jgi:hypothetical protein
MNSFCLQLLMAFRPGQEIVCMCVCLCMCVLLRRDDTLWRQRALDIFTRLYDGGYVGLIIVIGQSKFMAQYFSDYVNRHFYVCDRYERSCAGGWELLHDIKVSIVERCVPLSCFSFPSIK